jgi:starch synthase
VSKNKTKILFASSEVYPLIKTGGLADVSQALPRAIHELNHDVRIVLPAYKSLLQLTKKSALVHTKTYLEGEVKLYETTLPKTDLIIWLVDCPQLFDREGGPYTDHNDEPWEDNAQRFALFSRVIASIATNNMEQGWQPDVLHCNDWQTGLAPALLHFEPTRPKIIFTIHNLAYQGVFPLSICSALQLPDELASFEGMEFYNQFSFIKGGIIYADYVTTVSPTYANEIQTSLYGAGLENLLKFHSNKLSGIINGINEEEWDPESDKFIHKNYNAKTATLKKENKTALQNKLKLTTNTEIPLFSTISRLVSQKGIDLIIDLIPQLMALNAQLVILGKGDEALEDALLDASKKYPEYLSVCIGYDEALAHQITAAADFFLMPSRFEPCGLNQMYSQRYGTIPIVRKTGGLADTVTDRPDHTANNTGIIFEQDNSDELLQAINRGLALFKNKPDWKNIQHNAMTKNFSWKNSAQQYLELYSQDKHPN